MTRRSTARAILAGLRIILEGAEVARLTRPLASPATHVRLGGAGRLLDALQLGAHPAIACINSSAHDGQGDQLRQDTLPRLALCSKPRATQSSIRALRTPTRRKPGRGVAVRELGLTREPVLSQDVRHGSSYAVVVTILGS